MDRISDTTEQILALTICKPHVTKHLHNRKKTTLKEKYFFDFEGGGWRLLLEGYPIISVLIFFLALSMYIVCSTKWCDMWENTQICRFLPCTVEKYFLSYYYKIRGEKSKGENLEKKKFLKIQLIVYIKYTDMIRAYWTEVFYISAITMIICPVDLVFDPTMICSCFVIIDKTFIL